MSGSAGEAQSHSTLKEFLASIAAIRGDLSNITAPPFVLDTKSVVELPAFWAERPAFFVAPAAPSDPAERALAVLKWFLVSLKNQQYAGRSEEEGVKKPLNAFLGECFLANWEDDCGETVLVSEQVSHHPPVTACRLWNEEYGVSAEGFTRQEITFALDSISIKQTGHALLTLKSHDNETYLIPLPNVKVKGMLSGLSGTYPELDGTYTIPSTSGYYSVIQFSGKSLLGSSTKHEFVAKVYAPRKPEAEPLYTVKGHWHDAFTIYEGTDTSDSAVGETLALKDLPTVPLKLLESDIGSQDPWETRRAWKDVREALIKGDMSGSAKAKSVLEQGQREMRKDEERAGKQWQPLFFQRQTEDPVASSLYRSILKELKPEATVAIWKFDETLWKSGVKRPFHDKLTPDNKKGVESEKPRANNLLISNLSGSGVYDDEPASPASFKTAHEFPTQPVVTNGSSQPAKIAAIVAQPVTPVRQSIASASNGGLTPSSASVSPSTRRGKRQKAKESIGKFRHSLSSGFSKLGSSPARSDSDSMNKA
ncbi:hypothetical protein N0V93_007611 [Gnomoniopsis smithogilvyi]|uniref:Oxysterol-binding protein n=1 Tax=Gnomoniopsis smithogilvyi TaxID=1191159 RepID=A0A9W8YRW5_9PEZI|nr:hypothetical protein N0V93_007611 [Gnomoniopsis smithogilvyi]